MCQIKSPPKLKKNWKTIKIDYFQFLYKSGGTSQKMVLFFFFHRKVIFPNIIHQNSILSILKIKCTSTVFSKVVDSIKTTLFVFQVHFAVFTAKFAE